MSLVVAVIVVVGSSSETHENKNKSLLFVFYFFDENVKNKRKKRKEWKFLKRKKFHSFNSRLCCKCWWLCILWMRRLKKRSTQVPLEIWAAKVDIKIFYFFKSFKLSTDVCSAINKWTWALFWELMKVT